MTDAAGDWLIIIHASSGGRGADGISSIRCNRKATAYEILEDLSHRPGLRVEVYYDLAYLSLERPPKNE